MLVALPVCWFVGGDIVTAALQSYNCGSYHHLHHPQLQQNPKPKTFQYRLNQAHPENGVKTEKERERDIVVITDYVIPGNCPIFIISQIGNFAAGKVHS